jgi:hypothetical protein
MSARESRPEAPPAAERRTWSRLPADALPDVKVALKSGTEVELMDVSRGGAQFRTAHRLLPGLNVTLRLITSDGEMKVQCRVARSSMVRLESGALGYEVGVAFDGLLPGVSAERQAQARADVEAEANEPLEILEPPAVEETTVTADVSGHSLKGLIDLLETK